MVNGMRVISKSLILMTGLVILFSCSRNGKVHVRPNILWITCEDISPYLGCYGFEQAVTPNLDKLAELGIRYTQAYANAPVCGVARSTLLTGMYASTTGTNHMRCLTRLPGEIPAYPLILREAGYYCTNNVKTDYNSSYEPRKESLWDETSRTAHWKNRPEGVPFFSVFNITVTHEGQLSETAIPKYVEEEQIPPNPRIDPAFIELPPYHPDLVEIRTDWARLHDLITLMDEMVGAYIKEIEEAGLDENTIVIFHSDHGGQLSRSKRFIYNGGTQVPMIIYLPKKWRHLAGSKPGEPDNRLVSFIDIPKTLLSIAGADVPDLMQGRVFLGKEREEDPGFVHFYRDRMGSKYDFSRAVTDGKYYFIRNFMPHRPRGRDSRYGYWVQANWGAWEEHFAKGKCDEVQSQFYMPKPPLQLFDNESDPWQVENLAGDPGMETRMKAMSDELDRWMIHTRDVGLIPEPMFLDLAGPGKKYGTIYEFAQSGDYHPEQILQAAKSASTGDPGRLKEYITWLNDEDPVMRYWGAYALFMVRDGETEAVEALRQVAGNDTVAANRLMAAQALGVCGDPETAFKVIRKEALETTRGYVFLQAINAFQYSKTDVRMTKGDWEKLKGRKWDEGPDTDPYGPEYALRIIDDALELWPERRIVY